MNRPLNSINKHVDTQYSRHTMQYSRAAIASEAGAWFEASRTSDLGSADGFVLLMLVVRSKHPSESIAKVV